MQHEDFPTDLFVALLYGPLAVIVYLIILLMCLRVCMALVN